MRPFTGRMAFPGPPGEELFNSIINQAPLSLGVASSGSLVWDGGHRREGHGQAA